MCPSDAPALDNFPVQFSNMKSQQPIVPGLSVDPLGLATVDPSLQDVLFDLALALEQPTNLPVDMEHVVAALVLASRNGELDCESPLCAGDDSVVQLLVPHVKSVFALYGGRVGEE